MKHEERTINLAKQRNRNSAERTLLAWIRTSLALIGFGFGIPGILDFLLKKDPTHIPALLRNIKIFGLSFIALGLFGIMIAVYQYRVEIYRINHPHYTYKKHSH